MKLSGLTIIIFFVAIGLSAIAWVGFQIYLPYEKAAAYNKEYLDQLNQEAAKQSAADKRVEKAMQKVQQAADQWNVYVATRTPSDSLSNGGINLAVNSYQLTVDSLKFRDSAQRAFNAQLKKGGVKVVNAPEIPFPGEEPNLLSSYFNYPAFSFPVVLWQLGTVTVTGTYERIMANVRSWASMPHYLAVADGLQIEGTTPNLTATYSVTVVGFLKGNTFYPPPTGAPSTQGGQSFPTGGGGGAGPGSVKGGGGAGRG